MKLKEWRGIGVIAPAVLSLISLAASDVIAQSTRPENDLPAAIVNSPAYQSYQELLKSEDLTLKVGTYACFAAEQSKTFTVIGASLLDKQTMTVMVQSFTSGVSDEGGNVFEGPLKPYSGNQGLFATLKTRVEYKYTSAHETDVFEWAPEVLTMKTGFGTLGKLSPNEVPLSYEFRMQRSTGRYTEHVVFDKGVAPEGFTNDKTGKCIRIPNTQTPEESYRSLK